MTDDELKAISGRNERSRTEHVMTRWEDGRCRSLFRGDSEQQISDVDTLLAEVERLQRYIREKEEDDNARGGW